MTSPKHPKTPTTTARSEEPTSQHRSPESASHHQDHTSMNRTFRENAGALRSVAVSAALGNPWRLRGDDTSRRGNWAAAQHRST